MRASQKITHLCTWKRQIRNIVKMVASVLTSLRQRPLNAEALWKRSVISSVRPTVHTNPSRKRSYPARSFFENNDVTTIMWFPWPSLPQTQIQNIWWLFRFSNTPGVASTEPNCQTHKNHQNLIKYTLKEPWWLFFSSFRKWMELDQRYLHSSVFLMFAV